MVTPGLPSERNTSIMARSLMKVQISLDRKGSRAWDAMANRATGDASLTDVLAHASGKCKNLSVFTKTVPIGKANQVKEWWKRLYENPGVYHFAGRQCTTTVCRSLRRAAISNVRTLKQRNLAKKLRRRGWKEQ